ncbi:hypothetical protein [uncultured Pantoea sp.]|uniref:hypothetical protein n=1 Tax=uncultured Pantoea sp. TaxID=218084 RepID=UPI00258326EB|nr:hypothetical protein [uncultured Pantoea sp.]
MVSEQAIFTFYKVHKAGFYRPGESEPSFGSLREVLADLNGWAAQKTLKETKTFEADEERFPAYLVDAKSMGDDWIMLLWNEVPSNGQRMPSLSENARYGADPEVVMSPIPEGNIPGFATYFWFIADRNLMATVRLHNKVTAQGTLQKYIRSFLKQSSQHAKSEVVELEDGSHELQVTGYMLDIHDDQEEKKYYQPRFNTGMLKNPGKHEEIRQKANFITKIERVLELNLSTAPDLALWQKLLDKLNARNVQAPNDTTKVKYIVSPDVGLQEVNDMITQWEQDPSEVNDYGFVFKGEPEKIYWLSNSLSRTKFELRIERENDEIVNLQSLLTEIVSKKDLIFRGSGLQ